MFSGFGAIALFAGGGILLVVGFIIALTFRRVVRPNEVHIVQSSKGVQAYGVGQNSDDETAEKLDNGNAYYEWPTAIPKFGVQVVALPLSVFDEALNAYDAYDIGKVPFVVDIVAFFRIAQPSIAAKRIETLDELQCQLKSILQGAVRTVLAQHEIEQIMEDRSTFGDLFTALTKDQLAAWGVVNVKNIELMDIRDPLDGSSKTVQNIMAKKQSKIDAESRTEVAENNKTAETAEIAANQEVAIRDQQAQELVGKRTAEKDQAVGIADEQAKQSIQAEAATTKTREMAVLEVETVRTAEINKEALLVAAAQEKETRVIKAEGEKTVTITVAEGNLAEQQRAAEGTLAVGTAEAEAKRLAEMASVSPQLALAAEIGENEGYQTYLIQIRNVEKDEVVGVEQAKALQDAGIKVIANTGNVTDGVQNVMDLFTSKGGTSVGAAVEAFAQTESGEAVLGALGLKDAVVPPTKTTRTRANGAASS
jgi:flotillin